MEPARLPGLPDDERVQRNPWAAGVSACDATDGPTLLVGTGLTAVDTILSLTSGGSENVIALSRSGEYSFAHLEGLRMPAPAPELPDGPLDLPALERHVCTHFREMESRGYDWRDVIDGTRPVTPALLARLSESGRERFLAERAREWERRRHRMAPRIAERLSELTAEGRVTTLSGSVAEVTASSGGLQVTVAGGEGDVRQLACSRIIVCAGASVDVSRSGNPLLQALLDKGHIVADPLGLGLQSGSNGALVDAAGSTSDRLFTLGPLLRGDLWETTAVGEIRVQARDLALEVGRSLAVRPPGQHAGLAAG